MNEKNFYDFLLEIAAIAKVGLLFSKDPYAISNYQTINVRTKAFLEDFQGVNLTPNAYFDREVYPTPNVSVRTVCFNEKGEVLLVQEAVDHCYSLPGGWCDLYQAPSEAAKAECLQEAGAEVNITRLVGVLSRTPYKSPVSVPEYVLVFAGEVVGQLHQHEYETTHVGFFPLDQLPELSKKVSRAEVVKMIYAAANGQTIFD